MQYTLVHMKSHTFCTNSISSGNPLVWQILMLLPICFTTIYSFLENLEGVDILTTYEISPAAAEDLGY